MICKHGITLNEALPVREWQRFEAVQIKRHSATCKECQMVLMQNAQLDSGLSRLPQPEIPAGFLENTLARINRLPGNSTEDICSSGQTSGGMVRRTYKDVLVWMAALGGTCIATASWLKMSLLNAATQDWISLIIKGRKGIVGIPDVNVTTLCLGMGFLLYLAGFLESLLNTNGTGTER